MLKKLALTSIFIFLLKINHISIKYDAFQYNLSNSEQYERNKYIHNYHSLNNPKISVIMPIYNGGKYLNYSLQSILNQQMKEIEIILIDDCSKDDSNQIIKKYINQDERIKLIKNHNNRQTLYSKSIGALNSKGKYIIQLDQDDMFINNSTFNILYHEAEKYDLDLVRFNHIRAQNFSLLEKFIKGTNFDNNQIYKTQPQLSKKIFLEEYYLLWGFLIKSELYKKAIYNLWPIIINYKIIFQEDFFVTSLIVSFTKRYKKLNFIGLFHLFHNESASKEFLSNEKYYLSMALIAIFLYDYYAQNNPQEMIIIYNYIKFHIDRFRIFKTMNPRLFNIFMRKIFLDKNISFLQKYHLIKELSLNRTELNNIFLDEELQIKIFKEKLRTIKYYQDSLINENIITKNFSIPNITIVIVLFDLKNLRKTIKSIMNQTFLYFEIILIYNNCNNTDLYFLNNYIKNFVNIKLINNEGQKGFFYSIVEGVLSSSGKYILILKPNYTLAHKKVLKELYNELMNENIEILEFNLLINDLNLNNIVKTNNFILYRCSHFKSQLNLEFFKYNKEIHNIDIQKELLFNKLIKAELFKKIIKKYRFNTINENIDNYYHEIFLYALENEKIRFRHINNLCLIKNIKRSNFIKTSEGQKVLYENSLFYINFLFNNSKNSFKGKKTALKNYFDILSLIYNKFNRIPKQATNLYKKFVNSKYIDKPDKILLKFYIKSLIN